MNLPVLKRTARLTSLPGGVSLNSGQGGEQIQLLTRSLVTSDDGPHLYQYLDDLFHILAPLLGGLPVETIQSALINITNKFDATIWINPQVRSQTVMPRRDIQPGRMVFQSDLAHIHEVVLDIDAEPTQGALAYTCREGWRQGLFFDFSMLQSEPNRPIENFRELIGNVHNELTLRARLRFPDARLPEMYGAGWFPFIGLPTDLLVALYNAIHERWSLDAYEAKVVADVGIRIPAMVDTWKKKPAFATAASALTNAARLYTKSEYRAAHSLALPHLEGVLRRVHLGSSSTKPNYAALRKALVVQAARRLRGKTAILPEQLSEFIDSYYLAPFDESAGIIPTSRHSLLHGVSSGDELEQPIHCVRLFLTLEQVFYCI